MANTTTISDRLIPQPQYSAPATGATINVNGGGSIRLTVNPATTIATLTITLPGSPQDNDTFQFGCTQIVTALTMNGGTIIGGLTTLGVGNGGIWVYSSNASAWMKM